MLTYIDTCYIMYFKVPQNDHKLAMWDKLGNAKVTNASDALVFKEVICKG